MNGYILHEEIHVSKYSHVYLATCNDSEELVVCKRMDIFSANLYLNEVRTLEKLNSKNLISNFFYGGHYYIILKYLKGGDLLQYLLKKTDKCLFCEKHEDDIRTIFISLLKSLKCIHAYGIIHADLKLENILFPEKDVINECVIIDFGLAMENYKHLDNICGSIHYICPELLIDQGVNTMMKYSYKMDMWSLGVILYVLLSGGIFPFSSEISEMEVLHKIKRGIYDMNINELDYVSSSAKDLIRHFLNIDPENRISIDEALNHPWIKHKKGLVCCNILLRYLI